MVLLPRNEKKTITLVVHGVVMVGNEVLFVVAVVDWLEDRKKRKKRKKNSDLKLAVGLSNGLYVCGNLEPLLL